MVTASTTEDSGTVSPWLKVIGEGGPCGPLPRSVSYPTGAHLLTTSLGLALSGMLPLWPIHGPTGPVQSPKMPVTGAWWQCFAEIGRDRDGSTLSLHQEVLVNLTGGQGLGGTEGIQNPSPGLCPKLVSVNGIQVKPAVRKRLRGRTLPTAGCAAPKVM